MEPNITVDFQHHYQIMDGFGATTMALIQSYDSLPQDTLGELRAEVIEKLYKDVGLNAGNLDNTVREKHNEVGSPDHIEWAGVDSKQAESMKTMLIDLAEPLGFKDYYFGKINTRWGCPWLHDLMKTDYERFLDECAEYLTSIMLYWRENFNIVPRYIMPFNEPLSGNRELADGKAEDIANIVKRTGARLRKEGFDKVKFIVPNEETEEKSLESASVILADDEARQYIGAIGYHPYPYGSLYASVPNILKTSGIGKPDKGRIGIRKKLADIAQKHGLSLWMTEVSHPEVDPRSFDHLRGRAIHIHDEFVYANATAYYAMNNMWDLTTHRDHFKQDDIYSEADTVVLANNETREVMITGIGYAIGHYARWIKPGATRVEAISSDPLILVTAFLDLAKKMVAFVVINNNPENRSVKFHLKGIRIMNNLNGECSTGVEPYPTSYWQAIDPWQADSQQAFTAALPGFSVTTIAGLIDES